MSFPYDFGFVPSTVAKDSDPVDVLALMDEPAAVGACCKAGLSAALFEGELKYSFQGMFFIRPVTAKYENLYCGTGARLMRILIADDHDVVRTGLRQLLLERRGWEVCGEAKTGREAVALALSSKPDVVVMDIGMPELNGLEAARQIRKVLPNTEIVILSLHLSDELVYEIVQAGVRGYVLKSDANRDLVNAVEALSMHRTFFTAKVSEMMLDGFCNRKPRAGQNGTVRDRLTSRQREIVQLLAEGKSSKEVAVALNISVKTAETHRANIMRKLELHSVSELVRYAVKNQIIEV